MAKRNDKMDQPEDALAMLKADHQRVLDLFQEYEAAQDQQAKRDIAVSSRGYTLILISE